MIAPAVWFLVEPVWRTTTVLSPTSPFFVVMTLTVERVKSVSSSMSWTTFWSATVPTITRSESSVIALAESYIFARDVPFSLAVVLPRVWVGALAGTAGADAKSQREGRHHCQNRLYEPWLLLHASTLSIVGLVFTAVILCKFRMQTPFFCFARCLTPMSITIILHR